jgi:uridylate kinase
MEGTGRSSTESPRWKRVLLKLSGEILSGDRRFGLDPETVDSICRQVMEARQTGVELALVVGGGNFLRGAELTARGMERSSADHMGMLATVMNSLAMQDALEALGVEVRVMSAVRINQVCEDYIRRRAVRHLEKGRVVIFAAGTGNPFFTTDTAASLRAIEIDAQLLLKATKVDGIYSEDPMRNPAAKHYPRLNFDRVLTERLAVMDATAIVMCRDHNMPLRVFNLNAAGDLVRIAQGEDVGTLVTND